MTDTQVVIIGGGAMGVSLMYHLIKQGWSDVLLVEKNDLTHGSTWHAAGLCTHFAHNATIQELRATSVRLYRDTLPEETGQDCGFHRSGAMRITRDPDRMDEFRHVAGLSAFTGYSLEVLTPERIVELHPLAKLDGLLGGIYEPDDGHVDPSLATNAMAQVAVRGGAKIWRNCPVNAIRRDGDRWLIDTARGKIHTRHVVNAAGTWGWEIGHMMGLNIPSVPVLHQYLVTDTVPVVAKRQAAGLPELPMIRDPDESWYVRQERDGLILGPYEKEAQVWSVDGVPPEFGADLMPPDLDRVEHIILDAMARIPALETGGVKTVVNGPITFTPDANPLIGPAHGLQNAWLLTGSSMGVMEGGGAGWFLAHWMTHGAPPMDALAVDSRRFGSWADRDYRVSKAIECFGLQFGVHYPYEERPAGRDILHSALHNQMLDQGAVMGFAYGWERPLHFAGQPTEDTFTKPGWFDQVASEVDAATNRVALADLSVFSKFDVTGDVTGFLTGLGLNRPPKAERIGLTHVATTAGGVQAEFTVTRQSEDHAYLTSAAASRQMDWDLLQSIDADVTLRDVTEEIGVLGLMGPLAGKVLSVCTDDALDFPWLSMRNITVADHKLTALRVSYIGEFGWELHVPMADMPAVYAALLKAGERHGIGHYGLYAANAMRLEKGYRAWGADLTTERSLVESGLAMFAANKDSPQWHATEARANDWDMVLLEIEAGEAFPYYAHGLWRRGRSVGIVTSAAFGHRTGKMLALAYLCDRTARTDLQVEILGKRQPARILDRSPFDPDNTRLRTGGN
ncbi:MAG: GcvT family protein [Paracoccaceae bacterium]